MKIIIPMTGMGTRFAAFDTWKPFITVRGRPIIDWTLASLPREHTILIVQPHQAAEVMRHTWDREVSVVISERVGKGPADTILALTESSCAPVIDYDEPVIVANSDQYVEWDQDLCVRWLTEPSGPDGVLATFQHPDLKWSFVRGSGQHVEEVRAKDAFGVRAVVGIYGWRRYCDLIHAVDDRMAGGDDFAPNGELYICPLYNWLIERNRPVWQLGVWRMWGLGDPEDVARFGQATGLRS